MRQIKVSGTYMEPNGKPSEVELRFTPTSTLKNVDENLLVLPQAVIARSNAKGYVEMMLYPWQPGMVPAEFLYEVNEYQGRQLIAHWYLRLDESTPDEITLTSVYPAGQPVDVEVYPTITDVRAIASDLDGQIYRDLEETNQTLVNQAVLINQKLGTEELGVRVPELISGKIKPDNIPAISLADSFGASSQGEMLAVANRIRGTVCRRTDQGLSYILEGEDSSDIASWVPFSDNFSVTSVNGKSGMVVLSALDVQAAPQTHDHSILSGWEYVATYLRGGSILAESRVEVTDGAKRVEVTPEWVRWFNSADEMIYELNPWTYTQWVTTTVNAYAKADDVMQTDAQIVASVRKSAQDVLDFKMTATGIDVPVYFKFDDLQLDGYLTQPLIGEYVATGVDGVLLKSDAFAQRQHQMVTLNFDSDNLVNTVNVQGTLPGVHVSGDGAVFVPIDPSDYTEKYALDVGTVIVGSPPEASITGEYPAQFLNITLPPGVPGEQGPAGVAGPEGPKGADGKSVAITGTVANAAALPTGLTPADVSKGWVTDNDGHLHVWSGTAYTDVGEVRGPEGPRGPQGVPGVTGPTGPQGTAGTEGPRGLTGLTGSQGPMGLTGAVGPAGEIGPIGPRGADGADGAQGEKGDVGNVVFVTDFDDVDSMPAAGTIVVLTP